MSTRPTRCRARWAQDLADKGRDPSALSLLLVPLFAFFKSFILRREFVNGVDGIVVSHMYAFQRFIRTGQDIASATAWRSGADSLARRTVVGAFDPGYSRNRILRELFSDLLAHR